MAVYGRVGIQKHGIVFTFSLHLFVCVFVLFYVCGLYFFFNYSISDFKETIKQFRAFSLEIQRFRRVLPHQILSREKQATFQQPTMVLQQAIYSTIYSIVLYQPTTFSNQKCPWKRHLKENGISTYTLRATCIPVQEIHLYFNNLFFYLHLW